MTIEAYLEAVKERCITDPLVIQCYVARERVTVMDGYLRARLALADGSQLEVSEYVQRSSDGTITVVTYSYHWADANLESIARWYDTPHFPDLPGFPDHIHDGVTGEVTPGHSMSIFTVLDEIAGSS